MKTLSLYIDKWYIVGTVNDDSGPHTLSLSNNEERIWLYFYNNIAANRVEYGYKFKDNALAGELNYYTNIFNLILGSEGKTYKRFGRDIEMRTIFQNAGVFDDLKVGFGEEPIETYVSFSSDIKLEGQSVFLSLLQECGFDVKGFVARLDFLALEYALKKGIIKNNTYTLVANATNENLHYSLYRQDEELFNSMSSKTLEGLGIDLRSRALVEQVIEIINASTQIISTDDEFREEHLYLSRFANEWIENLDRSPKNIPTPLGWVNFKKQLGNKYPVTVLKADIDERTSVIIDDVVTEMIKLLDENNIQSHELNNILFIGDTFDNGQFKKSLSQHIALSDRDFIHFHEKELGDIVNGYHELPSEWFDDDEENFKTKSEAEKVAALAAKEQREKLEAASKRDEEDRLRHQQEIERDRNLQSALTAAQDAEKKMQYDEALGLYRTASAIDPSNTYIIQKIEELTGTINELKSKKKQYEEYIHNARIAYDSKEWDKSIAQSMLALGVMPDSYDAKKLLEDAKSMATKYARLKECLTQIDFFIEKSAFIEAQREIENAEFLNIKDSSIEVRRRKVAEEMQRIQCSINELSAKFDNAVKQEDFDLAIALCSDLSNIDINNKHEWDRQKESLVCKKEQRQVALEKLRELRCQIDEKHLSQNWQELLSLCKAYLVIKSDNYITELSAKAEEQINLESLQRQFDAAYEERDWKKILSMSKRHSALKRTPANNRVIREAMAQNRKKSESGTIDYAVLTEGDVKESRQPSRRKGPRRVHTSSPITLLPEEEVKIEINKSSKKPFRKPSHSRNIASDIKIKEATKTEVEQNVKIMTPIEKEQSPQKRKFPTVKRNKF